MKRDQDAGTRQQRRHARALERRALRSGDWGEWERIPTPSGLPTADPEGWCHQVREIARCRLYVALIRPIATPGGLVHHLAIRTASSLEPPWRDKQRIKNELFGPERIAVEVMPAESALVDGADMYHIWILPAAATLPFDLR